MIDTELQDLPTCPFCGHQDPDWYDGGTTLENDDDVEVQSCPSCDMNFAARLHVTHSFTTSKASDYYARQLRVKRGARDMTVGDCDLRIAEAWKLPAGPGRDREIETWTGYKERTLEIFAKQIATLEGEVSQAIKAEAEGAT